MEDSVFSNNSKISFESGTAFLSKDKRIHITSIYFFSVFFPSNAYFRKYIGILQ